MGNSVSPCTKGAGYLGMLSLNPWRYGPHAEPPATQLVLPWNDRGHSPPGRELRDLPTVKTGGSHAVTSRHRLYTGTPWNQLATHLVGPMPKTPQGNQWILVLTDHFTRWQEGLPFLDERVLRLLGWPKRIYTDRGTQFESELITELCRL